MQQLQAIPVRGMGDVTPGTDLAAAVVEALTAHGQSIADGDVVVVTSKIVSKSEGRFVTLAEVQPSAKARALARLSQRTPAICELVLRECRSIVTLVRSRDNLTELLAALPASVQAREIEVRKLFDAEPMMLLAEMPNGTILTDAGIDTSNVEGTTRALLSPENPDESCRRIREGFKERTGKTVAVIVSDTDIRPGRHGTLDLCLGSWGIETLGNGLGRPDMFGKPKVGGVDAISDIFAATASLVMGQTDAAIPAVVLRGLDYEAHDGGMRPLIMPPKVLVSHLLDGAWFKVKWALMSLFA